MPRKVGNVTLYSIDDLHEKLGVSKVTLRAYLREGRLKGRKLGVQWFVTEDALRDYFEGGSEQGRVEPAGTPNTKFRYVVQGVNDLVSEQEECETLEEAISSIKSQAIISLFQVAVIDKKSGEIAELVRARDFLQRYG
ncbi:MAG: helix-turn-helix domain-containing protein [Balneolaceae bacterium]